MSTARSSGRGLAPALLTCFVLLASALPGGAPALSAQGFTIEDVLSPQFPVEMASARSVDRIAWIAFERGARNIWTAVGPDFAPVRLTDWSDDRGHDLTDITVSDDGEVLVFVRGHTPNSQGWIANPFSDPRGSERAIWAIGSSGGDPWRVAEGSSPALSPDGRWVLFVKDGQIWRAPVNPGVQPGDPAQPLFRAFGVNSNPVWSPDGKQVAFVRRPGLPFGATARRPRQRHPQRPPGGALRRRLEPLPLDRRPGDGEGP